MTLWPWLILVAIYGACVGSFLNVVIYRLPEGLSLIRPPSHCPRCGHRLAIFDNVPILGWLWLGGKCRYCQAPISIQYPLIETLTALLFGGLFWSYYMSPFQPTWSAAGLATTWPALLVSLFLVASLVAATVIDARLYIIPLPIPWLATLVALVVLPAGAWWLPRMAEVCPLAEGRWMWAAVGGTVGLILANVLLYLRVLPRSFDDDPASHDHAADVPAPAPADTASAANTPDAAPLAPAPEQPATQTEPPAAAPQILTPEQFLAYPHPQREMFKELLFLALPVLGVLVGFYYIPAPATPALAWRVLTGVLLGYLVGGGAIWAIRILGTFAFAKEAMGLGDVHLLAAIGAVIGWKDAGIVFFFAPFLGITAYFILAAASRIARSSVRVVPYGPYLAAATLILMIAHKPMMDFFAMLYR